jgi:hypothetical protein
MTHRQPWKFPTAAKESRKMNAMIIYDTFDFAVRANARLERAAHRADKATHWNVNLWRVDVLKLPPAIEAALAEAADAHLIMLAISHVESGLPSLVAWLESWATGKQIREAALAIWDGESADTHLATSAPELSQFGKRHGLSLICNSHAQFDEVLEQPLRADDHHWGG